MKTTKIALCLANKGRNLDELKQIILIKFQTVARDFIISFSAYLKSLFFLEKTSLIIPLEWAKVYPKIFNYLFCLFCSSLFHFFLKNYWRYLLTEYLRLLTLIFLLTKITSFFSAQNQMIAYFCYDCFTEIIERVLYYLLNRVKTIHVRFISLQDRTIKQLICMFKSVRHNKQETREPK